MATDSSSGTLPSSSRLTIVSSSSIARSKDRRLTSALVLSGMITFLGAASRILARPRALLSAPHQGGHMGGGRIGQADEVVATLQHGDDAALGGRFGNLHDLARDPFEVRFHQIDVGERIAHMRVEA